MFGQIIDDNRKSIIRYALPVITFVIELIIPSPFIKSNKAIIGDREQLNLIDTVGMVLPDGSTYDGPIIASNKKRHGFGRLTTVDGSACRELIFRASENCMARATKQGNWYWI